VSGDLLERPPHYARVRALLGAFDAPVVQLWGWPGTGKRAILAALLEDEARAEYLPSAWLRAADDLEERLAGKGSRRAALLVCDDARESAIARAASLLHPGQRLLVAAERRLDLGRDCLASAPDQMLLRPDEIGELWRGASGRQLSAGECEWLRDRSDGWYFPLSLWARDPTTAGGPFDDEERFGFEAVADFVRERVVAAFTTEEAELARELARRGPMQWRALIEAEAPPAPTGDGPDAGRDRREFLLRSMTERIGLPRMVGDRLRLPRALSEYFETERRRAGGQGRGAAPSRATDAGWGDATPPKMPPSRYRNWREERSEILADVRIGLLGVPRVERRAADGMVPVAWSFKRPLRILAYLASAPDLQASREEIVSILWPESSEDAVRRNLHPAVSWLRRSVWPGGGAGGVVLLRDGVYSLDPTLHWEVDVRLFLERIEDGARHLARGRVEETEASWEAAWRLYQGAFLQGWSERWVQAQRDELQLRFTDLLRRLGDLKAQQGRLTEAEDAYRTLLLEDPLEEAVHVAIMRIYAARGRRDLVNRQYQRLREVLMHELRVEPSPPTLEAFNEIMLTPGPRAYR
jgi:DNA-binding SARP family transcriptional activator